MIVPASLAHIDFLAEVHGASFGLGAHWDAAVMAAQLSLPGTFGLCDAVGGMVLVRVVADTAEVLTLAVIPEARRQGRAQALLMASIAEAARRGAAALFLEVSEINCAARALYAQAGFTLVGKRPRYYPDGSDALTLRLAPGGSAWAGFANPNAGEAV